MAAGTEHPLELAEGTQKALDRLPASPDLKEALDTQTITWENIKKAAGPDASVLFPGDNKFDITFEKGQTLSQQLALSMCSKTYGELSADQRYLLTTIEMILKEQGINASAIQVGDKVSFNFEQGTYSYIHVETPASHLDGTLIREERVAVKEKSFADRERLLADVADSGSLFEAMRAYEDNPTYAGRVAFLNSHEGFADKVNSFLPADSKELLDPTKPNSGYKETNNTTQNIAFLKAYLQYQGEVLEAAKNAAPVAPVAPIAPDVPGVPKAAPAARTDADPLSVPHPTPVMPEAVQPQTPVLPPEAAPKAEEKTAEAVEAKEVSLEQQWIQIEEAYKKAAEQYGLTFKVEPLGKIEFAIHTVFPNQDASRLITITDLDGREVKLYVVVPARVKDSYFDPRVELIVQAPKVVASSSSTSDTGGTDSRVVTVVGREFLTGETLNGAYYTRMLETAFGTNPTSETLPTKPVEAAKDLQTALTQLAEARAKIQGLNIANLSNRPAYERLHYVELILDQMETAVGMLKGGRISEKDYAELKVNFEVVNGILSDLAKDTKLDPTWRLLLTQLQAEVADLEKTKFKVEPVGGEQAVVEPETVELNRAQHVQISEEMEKLSGRNAWGGVEDKYQALLALEGETPRPHEYYLAASAARDRGDIAEYEKRLKLSQAAGLGTVESDLAEIRDSYDLVELKGRVTVVPREVPFDPIAVKAIAFANQTLMKTGEFKGYLPNGNYTHNGTPFVVGEVAPVTPVATPKPVPAAPAPVERAPETQASGLKLIEVPTPDGVFHKYDLGSTFPTAVAGASARFTYEATPSRGYLPAMLSYSMTPEAKTAVFQKYLGAGAAPEDGAAEQVTTLAMYEATAQVIATAEAKLLAQFPNETSYQENVYASEKALIAKGEAQMRAALGAYLTPAPTAQPAEAGDLDAYRAEVEKMTIAEASTALENPDITAAQRGILQGHISKLTP